MDPKPPKKKKTEARDARNAQLCVINNTGETLKKRKKKNTRYSGPKKRQKASKVRQPKKKRNQSTKTNIDCASPHEITSPGNSSEKKQERDRRATAKDGYLAGRSISSPQGGEQGPNLRQ